RGRFMTGQVGPGYQTGTSLKACVPCVTMLAFRLITMSFFLSRTGAQESALLGHLEIQVLDVLWERGECNVHAVVHCLDRPLAYTRVIPTLDRLLKKGLPPRRKFERAFLYSPRLTRSEFEHKRAGEFVAGFLTGSRPSGELLISCLVEAVGGQDEA